MQFLVATGHDGTICFDLEQSKSYSRPRQLEPKLVLRNFGSLMELFFSKKNVVYFQLCFLLAFFVADLCGWYTMFERN